MRIVPRHRGRVGISRGSMCSGTSEQRPLTRATIAGRRTRLEADDAPAGDAGAMVEIGGGERHEARRRDCHRSAA